MKIADITPGAALDAVFRLYVESRGYQFLLNDEFEDEDPDEVRRVFGDAVEYALAELGVPSNAENCGEAADTLLVTLDGLAEYLEETSDR